MAEKPTEMSQTRKEAGTDPTDARVRVKRAYEAPDPADGERLLVDRLWPRGLAKQDAHLDDWLRELAPSDELRHWFGHDPAKWGEFRQRYRAELRAADKARALAALVERARHGPVTLIYSAKDLEHNNAVALKAFVDNALERPGRGD